MKIKLFTMVKNEIDIIDEWIFYHGSIFEYKNLFIIDNYSDDGTYEKLLRLKNVGINLYRKPDYKKKGEYMTQFYETCCDPDDIVYPLDIDEFIVFFDKYSKKISVDKHTIISYISNLPDAEIYKTNYINAMPTQYFPEGFKNAVCECNLGIYDDNYNSHAKSFMQKKLYSGKIDHGNHIPSNNYFMTSLCLVHFHTRNLEQIKKKIYCNVGGFGYDTNNVEKLKKIIKINPICDGSHHIVKLISILEKKFTLPFYTFDEEGIDLTPLNDHVKRLYP